MSNRSRLLALSLITAACTAADPVTQPPPPPPEPPRLVLSVVSGSDKQDAVAGQELPRPLQVRVTRDGIPQPDVPVRWRAENGTLATSGNFTTSQGIATNRLTLGKGEGPVTARASLYEDSTVFVEFTATRWPEVAVFLVSGAGESEGEVGLPLPVPITIRVERLDGSPAAGIPVHWAAPPGAVSQTSALTDGSGLATVQWTLGHIVGLQTLVATVRGNRTPVTFHAIARAGPVASVQLVSTHPPRPANLRFVGDRVTVKVTDRFGNPIPDIAMQWSADALATVTPVSGFTDAVGLASAMVRPNGVPGTASVLVSAPGGGVGASIPLTFTAPQFVVHHRGDAFFSPMNGTTPAIDTIPVGATLTWTQTPFDYDSHAVEPVGALPFTGGGEFPYANPSQVHATFTMPGTYQYWDPYTGVTGTVVVQ